MISVFRNIKIQFSVSHKETVAIPLFVFLFSCTGGCKNTAAESQTKSAHNQAQTLPHQLTQSLKTKSLFSPQLQAAFDEFVRDNKEHLEKAIQDAVRTAQKATNGTPEQKADIVISTISSVSLPLISPASSIVASMTGTSAAKIAGNAHAEIDRFLVQKRTELVGTFQKRKFGFPTGAQNVFTKNNMAELFNAQSSSDIATAVAEAFPTEPGSSQQFALSDSAPCAPTDSACQNTAMGQSSQTYGFIVAAVGLIVLVFGAGVLQLVSIPVIAVGIFFMVMGACVKVAHL